MNMNPHLNKAKALCLALILGLELLPVPRAFAHSRHSLQRAPATEARTGQSKSAAPPATSSRQITNRAGIEMVRIPPGSFMMGSETEKPIHRVTIGAGFYMGKCEVTQAQWKAVMGGNPSRYKGDDFPVERISWNDAKEFVRKLNETESRGGLVYRLPTEAEWEYACRAGSSGDYAGDLDKMAWYGGIRGNSGYTTHPVGRKTPNSFGLYDMHGNVWEWCEDTWHDSYAGAPIDGSAWVTGRDSTLRVVRGGGWVNIANDCRSASRHWVLASVFNELIGFRVVAAPRT
jgi:formylglycine-generating enzyme required for sulfatase activity